MRIDTPSTASGASGAAGAISRVLREPMPPAALTAPNTQPTAPAVPLAPSTRSEPQISRSYVIDRRVLAFAGRREPHLWSELPTPLQQRIVAQAELIELTEKLAEVKKLPAIVDQIAAFRHILRLAPPRIAQTVAERVYAGVTETDDCDIKGQFLDPASFETQFGALVADLPASNPQDRAAMLLAIGRSLPTQRRVPYYLGVTHAPNLNVTHDMLGPLTGDVVALADLHTISHAASLRAKSPIHSIRLILGRMMEHVLAAPAPEQSKFFAKLAALKDSKMRKFAILATAAHLKGAEHSAAISQLFSVAESIPNPRDRLLGLIALLRAAQRSAGPSVHLPQLQSAIGALGVDPQEARHVRFQTLTMTAFDRNLNDQLRDHIAKLIATTGPSCVTPATLPRQTARDASANA